MILFDENKNNWTMKSNRISKQTQGWNTTKTLNWTNKIVCGWNTLFNIILNISYNSIQIYDENTYIKEI